MGLKKMMSETAVFLLLFLVLVGCSAPAAKESSSGVQIIASGTVVPPTRGAVVVDLPDMGEAPEWRNDVWINSDGPITLASQRGKVVLLEFWTFG